MNRCNWQVAESPIRWNVNVINSSIWAASCPPILAARHPNQQQQQLLGPYILIIVGWVLDFRLALNIPQMCVYEQV